MNPKIKNLLSNRYVQMALAVTSYLVFWWRLDNWLIAALVMLNLYVHEMGHVWAMKRCGIPVVSVNFIPFLGAVAVPEKQFPSRRAEIIVALMGPIWGGAMAMLVLMMAWISGWRLLGFAALIMLFINLVNLIPINPFDGGRAWKSVVFSFHEKWQQKLLIGGTIVGFAALLLLGATTMCIALGIILGALAYHTATDYQNLRGHMVNLTLCRMFGIEPDEERLNQALAALHEQITTGTPEFVTRHAVFRIEPFTSALREVIAHQADQGQMSTWAEMRWRDIHWRAYELGMERCTRTTHEPLSQSELRRAVALRFLTGDSTYLPVMKLTEAKLGLIAHLTLAATLGGLAAITWYLWLSI